MRLHKIAVVPGDGIGPEVIAAGLRALAAVERTLGGFQLELTGFPWGSDYFRQTGRMMPEDGLDRLREFDAILFGAVGDPELPDDLTLWGLRLAICQGFDQYANVRPVRLLPGIKGPLKDATPKDIDFVIVRENSEGEYAGNGGRTHRGLPEEVGTDTSVFTRVGVTRIMRFAFELAMKRPRRQLTVVTKSNAQRHGMVMWDEIAQEVGREFPDVTADKVLVDAMTTRMILKPQSLDVVVATNLHADILSDLGAALGGSLGIGPTANLNPTRKYPSMFEPIHGSAFDLVGKGKANPIATFWTAVMMLEYLGEVEAANCLMTSIELMTSNGTVLTPDLGGAASTGEVTDALCDAIVKAKTRISAGEAGRLDMLS